MTPWRATKDFTVAVVGGGVCGLACAIALAKEGVHVDVYETTTKFKEIGAGIGLGPNAVRVLRELGVWEDVHAASGEADLNMRVFRYISGLSDHEIFYDNILASEDHGLGIARFSLIDALLKHFDISRAHFNKRCINVSPSAANPSVQILTFTDGTTREANVVIGADGIKSTIRSIITGRSVDADVAWSNTAAYRGLVQLREAKAAGVKVDLAAGFWCFMGPEKHIVTFPIQGGNTINVVAFVTNGPEPIGLAKLPHGEPWVKTTPQSELLEAYDGWGHQVKGLLKCLHKPSKWSICAVHPHLPSYVKGNVALIGDAAHAMLTHLGGGAGQGLEDALLLARLLGAPGTNVGNLERVLRIYDGLRRPRSQNIWDRSLRAGQVYEALGEHGFNTDGVRKDLAGIFIPVWHHKLQDDIQEGYKQIRAL
ncbi:hypothetical protein EUX98_g789 [Antrodiella citrinella]|uniref:FAD-binding domain-containing protein n=1 Tax=Antrodiella citrinella TaxID=2447956 RepID=A0A4S4N4V3_9APHY|nr:hypothetical protein EUX98_g789 [Antrodiella citrinella]